MEAIKRCGENRCGNERNIGFLQLGGSVVNIPLGGQKLPQRRGEPQGNLNLSTSRKKSSRKERRGGIESRFPLRGDLESDRIQSPFRS